MRRLWLLIALLALAGCPSTYRMQAQTAETIALTANAALPDLIEFYEAEGLVAIEVATSRDDALDRTAKVRAKWSTIWKAWDGFATAHGEWATALEEGKELDLGTVQMSYCGLRRVWPADMMTLVDWGCGDD